jgi:hypothetical protein
MNMTFGPSPRGRTEPPAWPAEVLAVRVPGGRVPEGCVGLSLTGDLTQRYPAGAKVVQPEGGALWWLRMRPVTVRLEPPPESMEVGLELALEPHAPRGLVADALVRWLLPWPNPVTTDDLHSALIGCITAHSPDGRRALPYCLPPCADQALLERLRQDLSLALVREIGWSCLGFARIDLYPDLDLTAAPPPATEAAERALARGGGPAAAVRPARAPTAPAPNREPPAWLDVAGADEHAGQRLFRELPQLADAVRRWPLPPPHDTAAFDRQLALRQRIEHLAATTNRLPALEGRLLPAQRAHAATLRLLAAAAQRALQELAAAWGVVDATPADHMPPAASLQRLEVAIAALEIALARRRTPWWEVEG